MGEGSGMVQADETYIGRKPGRKVKWVSAVGTARDWRRLQEPPRYLIEWHWRVPLRGVCPIYPSFDVNWSYL